MGRSFGSPTTNAGIYESHVPRIYLKKMRTGPTNPQLRSLIQELKQKAYRDNINLWERIAVDLEKPTRQKRIVNLSRINRYTEKDDVVIVPGKVLSSGNIEHPLTIAAWRYSDGAIQKLQNIKARVLTISELLKENPQGEKIKIIG